ncbi:DMT family transporter [Marinibaculum pumilum]|uniref:DMT family transporter n=1 Tax=Marinibaculum pumilum TaxID=1766165 RepID=A0ABV7KZ36_9PROT
MGNPATDRVPLNSVLMLLAVSALWGANWPAMKIGLTELSPFAFRGLVNVVGAAGLLGLTWARGGALLPPSDDRPQGRRRAWMLLAICGVINFCGFGALIMFGVELVGSGRAAALGNLYPVWAVILAVALFGERLRWQWALAVLLCVGGVLLFFIADPQALDGRLLGFGYLILGSMLFAVGTVLVRMARLQMPMSAIVGWQEAFGAVPLLAIALVVDPGIRQLPGTASLLAIGYVGIFTGILSFWMYFTVVAQVPVAVSTVGVQLTPVFGFLVGALLLNETVRLPDIGALLLIGTAVYLVVAPPRRR